MKCIVCDKDFEPDERLGWDADICETCQNQEWILCDDQEAWDDDSSRHTTGEA